MKKFSVPCNFGGQNSPFTFYIGQPERKHHPLHFQADWLTKERGGSVPPDVMESIEKIHALAVKNNVPFEELCEYALDAALQQQTTRNQIENQTKQLQQIEEKDTQANKTTDEGQVDTDSKAEKLDN